MRTIIEKIYEGKEEITDHNKTHTSFKQEISTGI